MTPFPPPLHVLEAEVMSAIWALGTATVREVCDELRYRGARDRAYTTIMTTCSRLAAKGLLARSRLGQSDLYEPVLTEIAYLEARAGLGVAALVEEAGDLALMHFARRLDALDPERRAALERLARGDDAGTS